MIPLTEEQEKIRNEIDSCAIGCLYVQKTLSFLEKELGKVHKITVDYRKGIYQQAMQYMRDAQDKADECGLIDVLIQRLNEKE